MIYYLLSFLYTKFICGLFYSIAPINHFCNISRSSWVLVATTNNLGTNQKTSEKFSDVINLPFVLTVDTCTFVTQAQSIYKITSKSKINGI